MKKKNHNHQLGSGPVEDKYRETMTNLARLIDQFLNGGGPKKNGFVLMMFPFEGHAGRCNYMSNAEREDVILMLREQLTYFEGMSDVHADDPSRDS